MRIMARTIIFERIRKAYLPLITYYFWRGYEVAVFFFTHDEEPPKWAMKMISNGRIKRIYVPTVSKVDGVAIDQTEVIYAALENGWLQKIIAGLYQSNETELVFKKVLVRCLYRCFYINDYLFNATDRKNQSRDIHFIPDYYLFYEKLIRKDSEYGLKSVIETVPKWFMLVRHLPVLYDMIKFYIIGTLYILFITAVAYTGKAFGTEIKRKRHFSTAVSTTPFQLKRKGMKGFEFLSDGEHFDKEKVLFLILGNIGAVTAKQLSNDGYNCFSYTDKSLLKLLVRSRIDLEFLRSVLGATAKALRPHRSITPHFLHAFFQALRVFVNYNLLSRHVTFDNYVYTNQESFKQIAFNILLRRTGKSWNYSSFIGGGVLSAKNRNFTDVRQEYWAYLNSDYSVVINNDVIDYNQLHRQEVRHYEVIGSIYSSLVCERIKGIRKGDFLRSCFRKDVTKDNRIVSFYDTTFIPAENAITNYQDAIDFYNDITRLVEDWKELFVIIKPSKSGSWFTSTDSKWSSIEIGMQIIDLFEQLKDNPRVFWAGSDGDSTTIMAVSDLVITHCMSSPTVEALGARKRAFWYESGNKHRGLLYDQIPGLITHGYEELEKRVNGLLYDISDEEYDQYLQECIRGKVEGHLDGNAVTRFRDLLAREIDQVQRYGNSDE